MRRFIAHGLMLAVAVAFAAPNGASASEPPVETVSMRRKRALALGHEGIELYNQRRWVEAYERFATADGLVHTPALVLYMARSKRQLGELLAARAAYQRILREPVESSSPPSWHAAHGSARQELDKLASRIPSIVVTVAGAVSAEAALTIDDKPVPRARWRRPIEIDPGMRHIALRTENKVTVEATVRVAEGQARLAVKLVLPEPPAAEPPIESSSRGSWLPGVITLGAAGAALAVGGVAGGVALGKTNALKEQCNEAGECDSAVAPELAAARDWARVSTGGFVAGAVLGVVGITLVLIRPGGEDEASGRVAPGELGLRFHPGGLRLGGRF